MRTGLKDLLKSGGMKEPENNFFDRFHGSAKHLRPTFQTPFKNS